jgi:16S rRNA (uracil1498-N3)-methyltransferase
MVGGSVEKGLRMTVPTWYLEKLPGAGERLRLTGRAHHYLVRVLRTCAGEGVRLCDGSGNRAVARVAAVDDQGLDAVVERLEMLPPRRFELTMVASPLKRKGTEFLAARCAELGVDRLVLARMDRSIARLEDDRLDRLERVAAEAARQVGQPEVTKISVAGSLTNAVDANCGGRLCFLWEDGGEDLRELGLAESEGAVCVVGPEGGFSEREVALLQSKGATPVFFRGAAYKAATAAVVGAVLFLYSGGRL